MARIRTIKPNHWNDKELSNISLHAHLLWIGTWNFSDDIGVFENDPFLLRSQIFPRRTDIRTEQVVLWLDQLVKARFIVPFTHLGIGYFIHRTFSAHQKIDRPQPSKIPDIIIRRILDECSTNVRPCIVLDSKGEEGSAPKFLKTDDKGIKLQDTGPPEMPLGHQMQVLFTEKNKSYPSRPSQDIPAIITIAEFINCQYTGTEKNIFELDIGQQDQVFKQWGKWCDWYHLNGKNKPLEYLVKFKLQEIFMEIKNGKQHGTHQGTITTKPAKNAGANELLSKLANELNSDG